MVAETGAELANPHMTPDEFRRRGHQLVEWIADYWAKLGERRVTSDAKPGGVASRLPAKAPETGESFDAIIKDLDEVIMPGLTHWQHPGFFAYFPANTSLPSVLGDLVASGLGVQGMLWTTGPACTELETVTLDWLADLVDLPEKFRSTATGGGVIQDSASSATLVATLAALHRASGGRWRHDGTSGPYRVYTSTQGHSSIEKAARLAGVGDANLRLIEVDENFAMRPDALRAAIEQDLAAGAIPALVVATIGTTSTTAIDPIPAIGAICREFAQRAEQAGGQRGGPWLHVDGAYAGAAAVCPEFRWSNAGLDLVDSYAFDPHKWLLTGFDCDAFWVADRAELIQALSVLPEYLRNAATESGQVIDYRDWQVPLARRFRALKLWFVLRWYGAQGLRAHIRHSVALAQELAGWIRADDRFEIVAPHPFSLVCFRLVGEDARTEELLRRVNAEGTCYLSHTKVDKGFTLRMAIGSPNTTRESVAAAWATIQRIVGDVLKP